MSYSGQSKEVLDKLEDSPQRRMEMEQASRIDEARQKKQASRQAMEAVYHKNVYLEAYKAELARQIEKQNAALREERVQKSTDRQCFVCKKPITDRATTFNIGGGLELLAHKRCLAALKQVVVEKPVDVSMPVGRVARKGNSEQEVFQRLIAGGIAPELAGQVAAVVGEASNWLTTEDIEQAMARA
jgi:hypothetical protein